MKRRGNSSPRYQTIQRGKAKQTKEAKQNGTPEDAAQCQSTDRFENLRPSVRKQTKYRKPNETPRKNQQGPINQTVGRRRGQAHPRSRRTRSAMNHPRTEHANQLNRLEEQEAKLK
jgi:hypothetical protein